MGLVRDFKDIFKPTALGGFIFIILSLVFMGTFVFVEHQIYLNAYQEAQYKELNTLQKKIETTLKNLKELVHLTNVRIVASQGDIKRIENILNSTPHLYTGYEFPRIKDVIYEKFSHPQAIITRFGVNFLNQKQLPIKGSSEKGPSIVFDNDNVISKAFVFNEHKKLEGMLEIQIDLVAFKAFLMDFKILSFVPDNFAHTLLQNAPFPIYAKEPLNFWDFLALNHSRYWVFFFYMVMSVFFIVLCAFKKASKNNVEDLEQALSNLRSKEEALENRFLMLQQDYKSQQTSFEAYKTLHANLVFRQKEQLNSLSKSLGLVRRGLEDPDYIEVLNACLNAIKPLSSGHISRLRNESIGLNKLLEDISSLFAEKIYKFNIMLEIVCPEDLYFKGDSLNTTCILITFIGKALYRAPKNGKVSIRVDKQNDFLHLEVQDNGYSLKDKELLIKNSFAFFISDDVFDHMCQESCFIYEYAKADNGFNVSKMVIPHNHTETVNSNVIQLFK